MEGKHRVALSVWEGRIAPVFDVSRKYLILDIENGSVKNRIEESFDCNDPVLMIDRLANMNVQILICGAVSRAYADILSDCNVEIYSFIAGDIDEVVTAYLDGSFPSSTMIMPGCEETTIRFHHVNRCENIDV